MNPATAAPVGLAAGDVNVAARQTTDYSVRQPVRQQELQGFWQQVQHQMAIGQLQEGEAAEQQRQWALGTYHAIGQVWPQVQEIGMQQIQMQKE